jgi:hypothetical protein
MWLCEKENKKWACLAAKISTLNAIRETYTNYRHFVVNKMTAKDARFDKLLCYARYLGLITSTEHDLATAELSLYLAGQVVEILSHREVPTPAVLTEPTPVEEREPWYKNFVARHPPGRRHTTDYLRCMNSESAAAGHSPMTKFALEAFMNECGYVKRRTNGGVAWQQKI